MASPGNKPRLRVGQPRRISPPGQKNWFPRLLTMPDGSILQFNATVADETDAIRRENGSAARISRDGGMTWQRFPVPAHYGFPVVLPDRGIRSFSYIQWRRGNGSVYGLTSDLQPDWSAWSAECPCELDLPRTLEHPNDVAGMEMDRSILLEPDGSLLATQYGKFAGDTKYRCIVVRSLDLGAHWSYLSTIAYDPDIPGEGYCEPVIARVPDGSLLAMMRTGGRTFPMYQSRSLGDGRTWGPPENTGLLSVDPDLCLMRNGILACSFGRPTVNIVFSLDGSGRTWTEPTTLFVGNSTCYTGLREVANNRLLLVYDSNPTGSPWEATDNQINALIIDLD